MLGALVAAIMAASFFLPWVDFFGDTMGPLMLLDGDMIALSDLPWQGLAFLASFALAALAAILAVYRRAAGIVMLVAGGIPFGIIGHGMLSAQDQAQELGLPLPRGGGDPMEAFDMIKDFIGLGLPAYFISAALLVLIGLVRMVRGR